MSKFRKNNFRQRVLDVVQKIRRGKILSYGEVARMAGSSGAGRAVGNVLKKNYDLEIPCHRVIRSDGKSGGYNRGERVKRKKLIEEMAI